MKDQLDALINQMIEKNIDFEDALGEFERRFIKKVLENSNGNLSKAAKALGIHRNTLSRKILTLGLDHRPKRRTRSRR
ncbi:MAG TPA: helix-turn-helix domain-containing protein [Terriglobia bacterium]|nr:helix-turn-helix domain-containing protein [Terriglobia bacterium]